MTKSEYISALANLIVNRVRFHGPIACKEIDFDMLEMVGIDTSLPIFKLENGLDKVLAEAFILAQKTVNFNLVTLRSSRLPKRLLKQLKNFVFITAEELGQRLYDSLNALNINYKSATLFEKGIEENYIIIDGEKVELDYRDFYLEKRSSSDGVAYDVKEFLLNGKNFLLSFSNLKSERRILSFEINIVLPRGYYHFSRERNCLQIKNLFSGEVAYFNFACKNAQVSFSSISGIESSTHACINFRLNIALNPKEQKRFYFNYGQNRYNFEKIKDAQQFFNLSQQKMREVFDVKTVSRNRTFDQNFNVTLPQKIFLKWMNFETDYAAEEEYLKAKQSVVKRTEHGYQIYQNRQLKQLQIFDKTVYKRVFIVSGENRFLLAGKTKYFNFDCVRSELFEKNNEIYLSFGA